MIALKQFFKLTWTEFRIFTREPVAVFFNLFFPLMFLFLTMHVFLDDEAKANGAIDHFIPSFLVIITTGVAVFNIPIYIVKYRNIKFLKRLSIAPLSPITILASIALANLLILFLGLAIVVALGIWVYDANFSGNWLGLIGACVLSFAALGSIGWVMGAKITGVRTVNVIGQLLYYPLLFLSTAIPVDLGAASGICKIIPTSYAVDLVKSIWIDGSFADTAYPLFIGNDLTDILVLGGVLVIGSIVTFIGFKWE